jgi:beta-glucanase (GH16 family)
MIKAKSPRTIIAVVTAAVAMAIAGAAGPGAGAWDEINAALTSQPSVMPSGVPVAQVGSLRADLTGDEIAAAWKPLSYNRCNGQGAITWSNAQLHLSTDGAANNGAAVISPATYTSGIFEAKINFAAAAHAKIADWPAFWLSSGWSGSLAWPYGGELDAAEGLGGNLSITYHYNANGPDRSSASSPTSTASYPVTATPGWQVVTVVWTAHRFDVYYDGTLVKTISGSFVENSPMNVIFDMTSGQPGHQPGQPASMDVAYVRIWAVK